MNFSTAFIICSFSLVIVLLAAMVSFKSKLIALLLITISILCTLFGLSYNTQDVISSAKATYETIISEMELEIAELQKEDPVIVTDVYYVNAEIVEQKLIKDNVYEIRFMSVDEAKIYLWTSESKYTEDVPYLLTMSSCGTASNVDDYVVVVWKSMN